ncbi:hypothetical protein THII_3886 [Thioploca ingrica]|jgi:hypothetical protein|uniref:Uncharacterized protein n=1 Tax=Thioploca ingrica TaxID=40754 RepID=A0A090AIF4_9GAMM|nr:hypothetical protein THII_3886 [Thioploca ingrica]
MLTTPLTNLQMELLELYNTNLTEQDLNELKLLLAHFYANKAIQQADKIWDERNFSPTDMEKWLNEPN